MSRSMPSEKRQSPATKFFEWKGKAGTFAFYDKEKKENIVVPLPFTFLVLDRLACITGYSKKLKTGFYSNEVRDVRSDRLVVKSFSDNRVVVEGFWADIKDTVIARGGKFAINLYIGFREGKDKELKMGGIKMTGSAMGPWFEFEKKHGDAVEKKAVTVKSAKPGESDTIEFMEPVYSLVEVSEETNAAAVKLDEQLQTYLKGYFARTADSKADHSRTPDAAHQPDAPEDHNQEPPQQHDETPTPDDSEPF